MLKNKISAAEFRTKTIAEMTHHGKHIEKLNDEVGDVRTEISEVKTNLGIVVTDVSWLKKWFWLIATSSIGALMASVANLLKR